MNLEKETGRGRLIPTQPTGVQYRVEYTIKLSVEIRHHGRAPAATAMRWMKCSVRSPHAHFIPDGSYFLHSDDGRVRQLKSTDGVWQYLSLP